MISLCVPVYRVHGPPNLAAIAGALGEALAGEEGELVVALNGLDAAAAGAAEGALLVDLGVNRGVAPGWNAAANASSGDVLVFCNDDVELGAASLARMAEVLREHEEAGVVGPVGSRWDLISGTHLDFVEADASAGEDIAACEVVSGFLFACRRATWEAVGGFDEFYAPGSWEEVDFCTAVRAAGSRCYAIAGVPVRHEWGVSRRQLPWARARWDGRSETWRSIHRRNREHFIAKWSQHPVARLAAEPA
jgi:GT2 family glycosyltransferase